MEVYADPGLGGEPVLQRVWRLSYANLSAVDAQSLQNHYLSCSGPWSAFTFIDPFDNMLAMGSSVQGSLWVKGPNLQLASGQTDVFGSTNAVLVTNTGQVAEEISQTITVPAGYQYCLSVHAKAAQTTPITLIRRGATTENDYTVSVGTSWTRYISEGKLSDSGTTFSAVIRIAAGQQLFLYGAQLEAQKSPSGFRDSANGGVYARAHWGEASLNLVAEGPDQFNVTCVIEANS